MAYTPELKEKLLKLLLTLNFDQQYYQFYESLRPSIGKALPNESRSLQERLLNEAGLQVKYDGRENFFAHREATTMGQLGLNAIFRNSEAEFVLAIDLAEGSMGGTFHGLAREVALRRDPAFNYQPRYPRLPYASEAELQRVIQFAVDRLRQVEAALLTTAT
ncbi:MAG: hypothetical protein U0175_06775 [Caldilineaceae bacterium]